MPNWTACTANVQRSVCKQCATTSSWQEKAEECNKNYNFTLKNREESNMTDKNTDYSNLKEKTIFDFCKDEKMIKDLVVSREDFFRNLKNYPLYNAHILIEYAEITKNKKLLRAVLKQYKQELEEENNE